MPVWMWKEVMAKVEELQQKQAAAAGQTQEAAEDENVIDIEPKAEITYDDFCQAAVPGRRDHCL